MLAVDFAILVVIHVSRGVEMLLAVHVSRASRVALLVLKRGRVSRGVEMVLVLMRP